MKLLPVEKQYRQVAISLRDIKRKIATLEILKQRQ